ncbi:MAG TPA: DNA-binding protein [Clostridiales bacterium]|nr:DNA-binding protein [Clostridiales bacterium]
MFEKNMKIAYLLDFYGDVLDEKCARIMEAYYEDDLSLAEIAEGEKISRQGVRHIIKKGEEELSFLEEKLGLAAHYKELSALAEELSATAADLLSRGDQKTAEVLTDAAKTILNKGV